MVANSPAAIGGTPHGLGYHGANVSENAFITYQGATG